MDGTLAETHKDIAAAIEPYFSGAKIGSGDAMKPAFHEEATIYGYIGDALIAGPIKLLYDWVDGRGPAPDIAPRITNVDVAGAAASVRVEVERWQQHRFTDLFNLLKIDGRWLIVNKIFHTHE